MTGELLNYVGMCIGGVALLAFGQGWLPIKNSLGRGTKMLLSICGGTAAIGSILLYVMHSQLNLRSWYALDMTHNACPTLYSLEPGLMEPGDLMVRHNCHSSPTTALNATKVYCPESKTYFFLYPDLAACEQALQKLKANQFPRVESP